MERKLFRVQIRRYDGRRVKPEAEQIDGKVYLFMRVWTIDFDDPRYPGETAWAPVDVTWPRDAPAWIASGDLEEVEGVILHG